MNQCSESQHQAHLVLLAHAGPSKGTTNETQETERKKLLNEKKTERKPPIKWTNTQNHNTKRTSYCSRTLANTAFGTAPAALVSSSATLVRSRCSSSVSSAFSTSVTDVPLCSLGPTAYDNTHGLEFKNGVSDRHDLDSKNGISDRRDLEIKKWDFRRLTGVFRGGRRTSIQKWDFRRHDLEI